jgi:hypothetical protein
MNLKEIVCSLLIGVSFVVIWFTIVILTGIPVSGYWSVLHQIMGILFGSTALIITSKLPDKFFY